MRMHYIVDSSALPSVVHLSRRATIVWLILVTRQGFGEQLRRTVKSPAEERYVGVANIVSTGGYPRQSAFGRTIEDVGRWLKHQKDGYVFSLGDHKRR